MARFTLGQIADVIRMSDHLSPLANTGDVAEMRSHLLELPAGELKKIMESACAIRRVAREWDCCELTIEPLRKD